jgi:hypothetical protein
MLIALAIAALNHRTPWVAQVLMTSGMMGAFTYGLGLHATYVLTAAPMPRATAELLRNDCHRQLLTLAGIATALWAAAVWTGARPFQIAIFTLPLAILFVPTPAEVRQRKWRTLIECCISWLTFHSPRLPGLLQSPLGSPRQRAAFTVLATLLATVALIRMPHSPLTTVTEQGVARHQAVDRSLEERNAGPFERLRFGSFTRVISLLLVLLMPVAIPWMLAVALVSPVIWSVAAGRDEFQGGNPMQAVLSDMRRPPDLTERGSVYLGRVVADGSPVQVPREVFAEHAHGLGDSGGGKTSLFLCPLIEQLGMTGECSVIVIDNKADTLELLASLQAVAENVRHERGIELPLKVFSNQADKASFAFNPMTQPFWSNFDLFTRTDIICGANGLAYGSDYGQGYYSSANAAVLYHALRRLADENLPAAWLVWVNGDVVFR